MKSSSVEKEEDIVGIVSFSLLSTTNNNNNNNQPQQQ